MQQGASAEIGRFSDGLAVWPVGSIELRRSCAAGPPGRPAAPVSTRQYPAAPVSTRQYHAVPVSTRQYHAVPVSTMQYPAAPGSTSRTSGGSDVYSVGCDTLHAADRQQAIRRFGQYSPVLGRKVPRVWYGLPLGRERMGAARAR